MALPLGVKIVVSGDIAGGQVPNRAKSARLIKARESFCWAPWTPADPEKAPRIEAPRSGLIHPSHTPQEAGPMDSPKPLPRHQMAFLRHGQVWQLLWDDGDEALLIDTMAALVADDACPLDHHDQTLVEQQLSPTSPQKS